MVNKFDKILSVFEHFFLGPITIGWRVITTIVYQIMSMAFIYTETICMVSIRMKKSLMVKA